MESIEWIFTDHRQHMSMLQLLQEEQDLLPCKAQEHAARDETISAMVLAAPPLDGMPHTHAAASSTEWAVLKLTEASKNHQVLTREIQRYRRLLRLHDAVMRTLNEEERWFVENHYDKNRSLSSLPSLPNSPFKDLSRSTMSNYRKRLLKKVSCFLLHLQKIGL